MAPNKGESTVFKCSISSTTYWVTNFLNSLPQTCFASPAFVVWVVGTSCRSRGRGTAWWDLLCKLHCAVLRIQIWRCIFEAWKYFVASTECTTNINILIFSWHELIIMTVFPTKKTCISRLPPLLFVFVSLCGVTLLSSCWKCDLYVTSLPETQEESKYISLLNDENNRNAQWCE